MLLYDNLIMKKLKKKKKEVPLEDMRPFGGKEILSAQGRTIAATYSRT